jgi:hypothetical protein
MPPVGARLIAAKALFELLSRPRARRRFEDRAVVQPRLEVIGRRLDYHSRLKTIRLYSLNRLGGKVVDKAQTAERDPPS